MSLGWKLVFIDVIVVVDEIRWHEAPSTFKRLDKDENEIDYVRQSLSKLDMIAVYVRRNS